LLLVKTKKGTSYLFQENSTDILENGFHGAAPALVVCWNVRGIQEIMRAANARRFDMTSFASDGTILDHPSLQRCIGRQTGSSTQISVQEQYHETSLGDRHALLLPGVDTHACLP
jgi:hypothetical protein